MPWVARKICEPMPTQPVMMSSLEVALFGPIVVPMVWPGWTTVIANVRGGYAGVFLLVSCRKLAVVDYCRALTVGARAPLYR